MSTSGIEVAFAPAVSSTNSVTLTDLIGTLIMVHVDTTGDGAFTITLRDDRSAAIDQGAITATATSGSEHTFSLDTIGGTALFGDIVVAESDANITSADVYLYYKP